MNSREVVQRIRAYHKGQPLPRGATIHRHIAVDHDLLIVAFVKMGGESRPWGVAWGHPGQAPSFSTVPEARDRDLVAGMMTSFAPALLEHLYCPEFTKRTPRQEEDLKPLRQVWLPNGSHLDMVHQLAYAYTFTKWGDDLKARLNALGRASNWLYREANRPGSQHVQVGTDALRSAFSFPAENARQGHLGFLLAWLTAKGERRQRLDAALGEERQSIATSMDPEVERKKLEPALERWKAAQERGDERSMQQNAADIDVALREELARRFHLVETAISLLRNDKRRENAGVAELVSRAIKEQWRQYTQTELRIAKIEDGPIFIPSVETDRYPAAAGARFLAQEASQDLLESALIHHDADLLAEAISDGEAFSGIIEKVTDEGSGRSVVPIWLVRAPSGQHLKLRGGSHVCVIGVPNRDGVIRDIRETETGELLFEVEIRNLKTTPRNATGKLRIPAADQRWAGEPIAFCKSSAAGIAERKSMKIWRKDVPGAWVTHVRPGGVLAKVDSEDNDSTPVGAGQ
jgi:hypothetical protein